MLKKLIHKINGRFRRPSKGEVASSTAKQFKCEKCGTEADLKNVEFGVAPKCPKCNAKMCEILDIKYAVPDSNHSGIPTVPTSK